MHHKISIFIIAAVFCNFLTNEVFAQDDDLLLKGDLKKAYTSYNNALINEKNAENYVNMCRVLQSLNDDKQAKKYCMSALNIVDSQKSPDAELKSDILAEIGNIYLSAYRNNKITIEYYKQAETLKESNLNSTDKYKLAELYRNLGKAYFVSQDDELALSYWEKAEKISGEDEKFKLNKAAVLNDKAEYEIQKNNLQKAAEYLTQAVSIIENLQNIDDHILNENIYNNLAKCYEKNKKSQDKYIEYKQKAAEENAKRPCIPNEEDRDMLTQLPISELERLYKYFPYDIDVNLELGYRFMGINEDVSNDYLKNAEKVNPQSAYVNLGIAGSYCEKYLKTGDKKFLFLMNQNMRIAAQKGEYSPKIYKGLGIIKFLLNDRKGAELYFEKYIKYSKDKANAHCNLAAEYWELDDKKLASDMVIKHIESALKINPEIDETYVRMLVSAYRQNGDNEKAENTIKKYFKK